MGQSCAPACRTGPRLDLVQNPLIAQGAARVLCVFTFNSSGTPVSSKPRDSSFGEPCNYGRPESKSD